jgi:hypothetical protein
MCLFGRTIKVGGYGTFCVLLVMAMSDVQKMNPQSVADVENFAYALGKQAKKFSSTPPYRDFFKELIEGLTANMKPTQLSDLCSFMERFAAQRAKEERSGKMTHLIAEGSSDSDGGGAGPDDDLYDFM